MSSAFGTPAGSAPDSRSNPSSTAVRSNNVGTFPFYQLRQSILGFLSSEASSGAIQDMQMNTSKCRQDLLNPLRLDPLDAASRQKISSGKVKIQNEEIEVNSAIQAEILKMADELQLNEMTCFEYWYAASNPTTRSYVEKVANLETGSLRDDIPKAAREFYFAEKTVLCEALNDLLRARMNSELDDFQNSFIMDYTNGLLRDSLCVNLLQSLEKDILPVIKTPAMTAKALEWSAMMVENLFLVFFQTQILPEELRLLVSVLQIFGKEVQNATQTLSSTQSSSSSLSSSNMTEEMRQKLSEYASKSAQLLAKLQITLICALDQSHELIDRNTGDVNRIGVGNVLSSGAHSTLISELHQKIVNRDSEWSHKGFHGITLLAWGMFLSRSGSVSGLAEGIDSHVRAPAEIRDMSVILEKVEQNGGFQFLSTMMKLLVGDNSTDSWMRKLNEENTASAEGDSRADDSNSFSSLFADIIEDLFTGYCSFVFSNNLDFPEAKSQHEAEDGAEHRLNLSSSSSHRSSDSLEDVMTLCALLCGENKSFAAGFFSETGSSSNVRHQFLVQCRQSTAQDPYLFLPYVQLLQSIANGNASCKDKVFEFVQTSPPRLSWDHFFTVLRKYGQYLASDPVSSAGTGVHSSSSSAKKSVVRRIRPEEVKALEAILELISCTVCPNLANLFIQNANYQCFPTLFCLLQCAVPSSLKGAIMRTLAVFVHQTSSSYSKDGSSSPNLDHVAVEIWTSLQSCNLLPSTGSALRNGSASMSMPNTGMSGFSFISGSSYPVSTGVSSAAPVRSGLKYELEQIESYDRTYPATFGFLTLVHRLLETRQNWDGAVVLQYFCYIRESVLLKCLHREYKYVEEKYALLGKCLEIFAFILSEYEADPTSQSSAHLLACQVMKELSSESAFMRTVFQILVDEREVAEAAEDVSELLTGVKRSESSQLTASLRSTYDKCVLHCLNLLALGMKHEDNFMHQYRGNPAKLLDVLTSGTNSAGQGSSMVLTAANTDSLSILERVSSILLRSPTVLVCISQAINSTSVYISFLSVFIFEQLSQQAASTTALVYTIQDHDQVASVMKGYVKCVLNPASSTLNLSHRALFGLCAERNNGTASRKNFTLDIRVRILDMLLANLDHSLPNFASLLLGFLEKPVPGESSTAPALHLYAENCLEAFIQLLRSPSFVLEECELAEKVFQLVHKLLLKNVSPVGPGRSSRDTGTVRSKVLAYLHHTQFFAFEMDVLKNVLPRVSRKGFSPEEYQALRVIKGWILRHWSLLLHLHGSAEDRRDSERHLLSMEEICVRDVCRKLRTWIVSAPSASIFLLKMLDSASLSLNLPSSPTYSSVLKQAENCTVVKELVPENLETQLDGNKYLHIDVPAFHTALSKLSEDDGSLLLTSTSNRSLLAGGHSSQSPLHRALEWAAQWNEYSLDSAIETFVLAAWKDLILTVVLQYTPSSSPATSEPAVFLATLIETLVLKIHSASTASFHAPLLNILASTLLTAISTLRSCTERLSPALSNSAFVLSVIEGCLEGVKQTTRANGNVQKAKEARAVFYSCLMLVFAAATDEAELGLQSQSQLQSQYAPIASLISTKYGNGLIEVVCFDLLETDALRNCLAFAFLSDVLLVYHNKATVAHIRAHQYLEQFFQVMKRLVAAQDAARNAGTMAEKEEAVVESCLSFVQRFGMTSEGKHALLEAHFLSALLPALVQKTSAAGLGQQPRGLTQTHPDQDRWGMVLGIACAVVTVPLSSSLPYSASIVARELRAFLQTTSKRVAASLKLRTARTVSDLRELQRVTYLLLHAAQYEVYEKAYEHGNRENDKHDAKHTQWMCQLLRQFGSLRANGALNDLTDAERARVDAQNSWFSAISGSEKDMLGRKILDNVVNYLRLKMVEKRKRRAGKLPMYARYSEDVDMGLQNAAGEEETLLFSCEGRSLPSRNGRRMRIAVHPNSYSTSISTPGGFGDGHRNGSVALDSELVSLSEVLAFLSNSMEFQSNFALPADARVDCTAVAPHNNPETSRRNVRICENLLALVTFHLDSYLQLYVSRKEEMENRTIDAYRQDNAGAAQSIQFLQKIAHESLQLIARIPESEFLHAVARKLREMEMVSPHGNQNENMYLQ